ncbi:type VII secretion integral membrane protein EccD [Mycobacterium xenopi 4042]|uniref:Type VII secretion integral membrane protein EccD n=1 Tax=Mycobacterium xenopi 4042 TaxID=1299334 RepID=X8BEX9_MYCXE|nr:type VII secretion integral membrane protein EccD [Mycobacterium xenopi 4042]
MGVYTALVTLCAAATAAGLARMVLLTSAVTLLTCVLLACVLMYHGARRCRAGCRDPAAGVPVGHQPVGVRGATRPADHRGRFRWRAAHLGRPASVRDVLLRAERARSFLTGLLVGLGVLTVVCLAGLCDPHAGRRWLPLLLAAFTFGFLILRGRSYVDRWQAITLAATAVLTIAAVAVRYVLVSGSPAVLSAGVAVLVLLPAAGLTAAAVVPNTIYSPLFRKIVEWIEYLCLMPIFPLALWLMNVYEAIRYR